MQIDPDLSCCLTLKFIWIKDLKIDPGTLKLIKEKVGFLKHLGIGDKGFLGFQGFPEQNTNSIGTRTSN